MTCLAPQITLVHESEAERALELELRGLFAQYDLSKWFYIETVQIEKGVIPHSHPVSTLSLATRSGTYLGRPEKLLACYIHEQLHRFNLRVDLEHTSRRANTVVRERYTDLPIGPPEGCCSDFSNYLHIEVICLEYAALRELLGVDGATALLTSMTHYTAIYALVLRDFTEICGILGASGVVVPENPPPDKRFITPPFAT